MGYYHPSLQVGFEGGDFFRHAFRVPRKLRKFKLGRALGGLASFAAPLIPGVGGALAGLATSVRGPMANTGCGAPMGAEVGDPGTVGNLLGALGGIGKSIFGGGARTVVSSAAQRAAQILSSPIGRAVAGGAATAAAAAGVGAIFGRHRGGSRGGRRRKLSLDLPALNRAIDRIHLFQGLARAVSPEGVHHKKGHRGFHKIGKATMHKFGQGRRRARRR